MATVADYEDAVRRIAESDVPAGSTTRDEVINALVGSGPQVTPEVAQDMADALLTEERVVDAIESSGEIPSAGELDAIVSVSDDYDMDDRRAAVEDAVRERIATMDDFDAAIDERAAQDGPLFREQVDAAVDSVASEKEVVGGSPDTVTEQEARERGAPTETNYRRARGSMIAGAEQVSAADVLGTEEATALDGIGETTAKSPASVIRDESGETVGLTGAPTQEAGERMAAELGTEYVTLQDVDEATSLAQEEGRATLTFRGRRVDEVEL